MNSRLVELVCTFTPTSSNNNATTLTVVGPPSAVIYPPGYGWLYVLADGVPGAGKRIMVGNGTPPPEDAAATANMLKQTSGSSSTSGQDAPGG